MGATRRQMLVEGAASARAPDAAARRQPDDPVRALDGRHRRPDRWRRARRRRHERPLHEPGARDSRRRRDRDHGDGARPLDRGDRRRAPTRRSGISTHGSARGCGSSRSAASASAPPSWSRRSSSASRRSTRRDARAAGRRRSRSGSWPRSRACSTTCRTPSRGCSSITEPTATWLLTKALLPMQSFLVGTPWFITLGRPDADRVRHQRAASGCDDLPDARVDRRHRESGRSRWTRCRRCSSRPCSRS